MNWVSPPRNCRSITELPKPVVSRLIAYAISQDIHSLEKRDTSSINQLDYLGTEQHRKHDCQ
jgi:hypothetical protein